MERWIILAILAAITLLFVVETSSAAPFTCIWRDSCVGNEVGLLRGEADDGTYNNSHPQLMNYSGTPYVHTLCCDTDGSHRLNNSCQNENATIILRLSNRSNEHAEIPSVANYTYDVCMAGAPGNLTCSYINGTCTGSLSAILSMASSEDNGGLYNRTNAHLANASNYTYNVCCEIGNGPPTIPVLRYPVNNNISVFERNVTLNWTTSTDPDGDPFTYRVNLTVVSGSCSIEHQEVGITDTNFTTDELCTDVVYNWTVRACDASLCSDWAPDWNFTIASVLGVKFRENETDFGTLDNSESTDTVSGPGVPLAVENDGNIIEEIQFRAMSSLFTNATLNMSNFQYHIAENETSSYYVPGSQTTWENVSNAYRGAFDNLSYVDIHDDGFIHLNVTVPGTESAGTKQTTVVIRALAS